MNKQINCLTTFLVFILLSFSIKDIVAQNAQNSSNLFKAISTTGTWDDQFFMGGFSGGKINAIATAENGDIYVGGEFIQINGVIVNHITKWDGEKWCALGGGIGGSWMSQKIYAIKIDGNDVYVGGSFQSAGNVEAWNIAKWDGESWSALGEGTNSEVNALEIVDSVLYAGGKFMVAGNDTVKHIARWDGSVWSGLGSGLSDLQYDQLNALIEKDGILYAGGSFVVAGADTVHGIAQWDGQHWAGLGAGVDRIVNTLEFFNGDLYAGGNFTHCGDVEVNHIARWNGSVWDSVGAGLPAAVYALAGINDTLFVGGEFFESGSPLSHIAKWDGQKWSPVKKGLDANVYSLAAHNSTLLIGGSDSFNDTEAKELTYFTSWTGKDWIDIGLKEDQSVSGEIFAIAIDGNDVYVGGAFIKAGGDTVNNIAKWDGQKWSALGSGVSSKVMAIFVHNGDVYVGGIFGQAGGVPASRIAKWDGQNWSALGGGFNNPVYAIGALGNDIYAGGNFILADDTLHVRHIARWDGSRWYEVGSDGSYASGGGLGGTADYVKSISVDRDTLYASGHFTMAFNETGKVAVTSIAKWDGKVWSAMGKTFEYVVTVNSMFVDEGEVYTAVKYPIPEEGRDAHSIFKWDGHEWGKLGEDFFIPNYPSGCHINAITKIGASIYAGGTFTTNGDDDVPYISRWNGIKWQALDNTVNKRVNVLASDNRFIYAGGVFNIAGNVGSSYFGIYDPFVTGIAENPVQTVQDFTLYQNYPNPFNPTTTIRYQLPVTGNVELNIYNVLGQKVVALVSGRQEAGSYKLDWNAKGFASGVYFYRLEIDQKLMSTMKLVLLK